MACHFTFAVLIIATLAVPATLTGLRTTVKYAWAGGMQGVVRVPVASQVTDGWHMMIDFDYNVFDFDVSLLFDQ